MALTKSSICWSVVFWKRSDNDIVEKYCSSPHDYRTMPEVHYTAVSIMREGLSIVGLCRSNNKARRYAIGYDHVIWMCAHGLLLVKCSEKKAHTARFLCVLSTCATAVSWWVLWRSWSTTWQADDCTVRKWRYPTSQTVMICRSILYTSRPT